MCGAPVPPFDIAVSRSHRVAGDDVILLLRIKYGRELDRLSFGDVAHLVLLFGVKVCAAHSSEGLY